MSIVNGIYKLLEVKGKRPAADCNTFLSCVDFRPVDIHRRVEYVTTVRELREMHLGSYPCNSDEDRI